MLPKDEYKDLQKSCAAKFKYAQVKGNAPKLTPNTKCVDCGEKATMFDHRNYYKPLDVEPVCRKCNMARGAAYPYCEDINQKRAGLVDDGLEEPGYSENSLNIDFDFNGYDSHNEYLSIFSKDPDLITFEEECTNAIRDGKLAHKQFQKINMDGEIKIVKYERYRYKVNEYYRKRTQDKRAKG